jgi:hypothetical protein
MPLEAPVMKTTGAATGRPSAPRRLDHAAHLADQVGHAALVVVVEALAGEAVGAAQQLDRLVGARSALTRRAGIRRETPAAACPAARADAGLARHLRLAEELDLEPSPLDTPRSARPTVSWFFGSNERTRGWLTSSVSVSG